MSRSGRAHFRGRYLGVFRTRYAGVTHAAVFHDIRWVALEIRDVQRISKRDVSREKTGDYHYERIIRPRSRWGFGGTDLSIIKDDTVAFSEPIHDVVLLRHTDDRSGFSPARNFSHVRTAENEYVVEGVVYFSIPDETPRAAASFTRTVVQPVAAPFTMDAPLPFAGSENIVSAPSPIPSPIITPPLIRRKGCLSGGGCVLSFYRLLGWLLIAYLLLKLIGFVSGWLSGHVRGRLRETENKNVRKEQPRLDPAQDTLAPQPWNYLVDHEVLWNDFQKRSYDSRYTTSTYEFGASNKRHFAWANIQPTDELLYYHDVYSDLYSGDRLKLDSLVRYFSGQRDARRLDPLGTAEMVVTFVQEIPYVLVHEGTCEKAAATGGFIADYHEKGKPCLANIIAGVQSPYEFAHTMEGDCDTRALLAFTLLDRLGIGASVWVSREYGHSVLGVGVPVNSGNYKRIAVSRHFATELTVKGFRVGMIAPEHMNMYNWNVVLSNQ